MFTYFGPFLNPPHFDSRLSLYLVLQIYPLFLSNTINLTIVEINGKHKLIIKTNRF